MNNQTIARKGFDYNGLPDRATRATLRSEATAIKAAVKRTHDNIIEIGNRLLHAKEVAGHGKFLEWIEAEFGLGYDMANNFMNAAKVFSKLDYSPILNLSQTAIFALSAPSISEETRSVILEEAEAGNVKTAADVNEWADAAKPVKVADSTPLEPAPEPDGEPEDDPFGDEESAPQTSDETGYFDNDDKPEAPGSGPPKPAPPSLQGAVKNAQVVHDTLGTQPKPEELPFEEWRDSLAIYRVLKGKQHRAISLERDLKAAFTLREPLSKFAFAARRALDFDAASDTMFGRAVIASATLRGPLDWQVCAPCKGSGCQRCGFAGYDTTGAGISPLRVESGEAEL